MAYLEIWKSGKLIASRIVDEKKARKGCKIRLGTLGEVCVAIGQIEKIGDVELRMFSDFQPQTIREQKQEINELDKETESKFSLNVSADTPSYSDFQDMDENHNK